MESQSYAILVKIPCILASCVGTDIAWSPPSYSAKAEQLPAGDGSERFLNAVVPWVWLIKIIWWMLGISEILAIIFGVATPSLPVPASVFRLDDSFLIGVALIVLGGGLRLACYRTMSTNFTFELAIRSKHKLVTSGPYGIVRHPAYTGYIMVHAGLALWYGSSGSWLRESGILDIFMLKIIVTGFAVVHVLVGYFLLKRMVKEDKKLKEVFGKEWEAYAKNVPYALIPRII